jgi:hypothetical protein
MVQRPRKQADDRRSDLASEVREACLIFYEGKRPQNAKERVVRVAAALATMQCLLDDSLRSDRWRNLRLEHPESGLKEAGAALAALLTGKKHPIWDYIDSIRSGRFRSNKAPVNVMDKMQQQCAVGLSRAYQRAGNKTTQRQAASKVAEICERSGYHVSAEQIRAWDRADPDARNGADSETFANAILEEARNSDLAESLQNRVLLVGADHIKKFTGKD